MNARLEKLKAGMPIPYGGDHVAFVSEDLAAAFEPGDRLIVVQKDGSLLRIPAAAHVLAREAVGQASDAFAALASVTDDQITAFFDAFAYRLESDQAWGTIAAANAADVSDARARGRSTTRLAVSEHMRRDMIAGLRAWRDSPVARERPLERIDHAGWSVSQVTAPLGVVGFVFEGRPNVFADAVGVLRSGNAVVFRIGSDALQTARVLASETLFPALASAGLPTSAAVLLDSADRAAGWALFSDPRLSLAVARGSGSGVAQLGAIARQSGTAVSLHGTGGAWLIAHESADADRFAAAVRASLDRKVCNTLNVCCIVSERAAELVPIFVQAVREAGARRGHGAKLHAIDGAERFLDPVCQSERIRVRRADGDHEERFVERAGREGLSWEWEWEETPEVSLVISPTLDDAIALFNAYSPQFIVSLIAQNDAAHAKVYARANAAFVGDGFTRWVDGQYALDRPELGLSNWQGGRLFARGGVLSGDGVYTVRTRMTQSDMSLRR